MTHDQLNESIDYLYNLALSENKFKFLNDSGFLNDETKKILIDREGAENFNLYYGDYAILQGSNFNPDINELEYYEYFNKFKNYLKSKYIDETNAIDIFYDSGDARYFKFYKAFLNHYFKPDHK